MTQVPTVFKRHVLEIRRTDDGFQTLSVLLVFEGPRLLKSFYLLTPPWKNNEKEISCIPSGRKYILIHRESEKYGKHLRVLNDDGSEILPREMVLLHNGNYRKNTLGCGLVGKDLADLNGDGELDVTRSKDFALPELVALIPQEGASYTIIEDFR